MDADFLDIFERQLIDLGIAPIPIDEADLSDIYHCHGKFYIEIDDGLYQFVSRDEVKAILMERGMSAARDKDSGELTSALQRAFVRIVKENSVEYAGKVGGFPAGLIQLSSGDRILVTSSPNLVEPVAGDCSDVLNFINGLFGKGQVVYFHAWLREFVKGLRNIQEDPSSRESQLPGQALIICGEPGCGKTLFISLIVRITGSRRADPFSFMIGSTDYNGELLEIEWAVVDDRAASKDPRDRNTFGAALKQMVATSSFTFNPKYKQPVSLWPYWRLIISANSDPDSLAVLPTLGEGIDDKVMLLKAAAGWERPDTSDVSARKEFMSGLISQLPAYVHWLLNDFELPEDLVCGRFGIKHFHHPELLLELSQISQESTFLEVVDDLFRRKIIYPGRRPGGNEGYEPDPDDVLARIQEFDSDVKTPIAWEGTAAELEAIMRSDKAHQAAISRLCKYENSLGTLLRKLSHDHSDRIERMSEVRGVRRWRISAPNQPAKDNTN